MVGKRSRKPPEPPKARVLIVDDDERNAFAASEALAVLGHELVVARSGEEALRLLLKQEFAVILLDLHMPGMDGYETARLIREHPRTRGTPIVFVTAVFRDEAHIFQAYSVGAVDVVFKPVDPFILRAKVAVLTELYLKTIQVRLQGEERHRLMRENATITEARLSAELTLRRTRERQDAILRSLPVVFTSRATLHPFGASFVSDSITPMTGFEPSRFIEEPEIGLGRIHPDDVAAVAACLMNAAELGGYACEYRWQCADGEYRTFLDQGVWVPGQDGAEGEIVGTLLDVTERRQLEEHLSQARKMEAVGQLTGGVAHDFNNLLTVVLGNADILLRKIDDPRINRQLGAIRAAAERGQSLTRQLLAFSRRQTLNPEPVDLNRLVRDFAPLIRQAVGEGVALDLRLSDGEVFVSVDAHQFENALLNLAVNARDAMDNDGQLTISVSDTDGRDEATGEGRLVVTDTGQGMSPEVVARVFEPFYTTKEVGRGSGLGLSQVYGFVKQSGGRVDIDSRPGAGAAFTLALPLTSDRPIVKPAPTGDPSAPSGSERVLIVEDDPAVLSVCLDMLRELGYHCEVAIDAAGALQRLKNDPDFDLLFSDVVMPGGINGIELARRARGLRPDIKVLLTSGYVGEAGLGESQDFEVIDKPYQRTQLAERLRSVFQSTQVRTLTSANAGS